MTKDQVKPYFTHDVNADGDPKHQRLIMKYGSLGIGIYWRIVERLYRGQGKLAADYAALAFELRDPVDVVTDIATNFDLFYLSDGGRCFGSRSVDRRLLAQREKSAKAREAAYARHRPASAAPTRTESPDSCERSADAVRTHSDGIADAVLNTNGKEPKGSQRPLTAVSGRARYATAEVALVQREPDTATVRADAVEARLLDMKYPVKCDYHGWKVRDLPAAYCLETLESVRLGKLTRIGDELQRALQARINQHVAAARR